MPNPHDAIPADQLDLLASAAQIYGQLVSPTTAVFCPPAGRGRFAISEMVAARLLHDDQLAALRRSGGSDVTDADEEYEYRPVDTVDPVAVLKACDSYEDVAEVAPGWASGEGRRLISAIRSAAIRYLPGYDQAPVRWTRPSARPVVIGARHQWTPIPNGVDWLPPGDIAAAWSTADHILITVDAIGDLPTGLAARPDVYLLAGETITTSQWKRIAVMPVTSLVMCPIGLDWLLPHIGQR